MTGFRGNKSTGLSDGCGTLQGRGVGEVKVTVVGFGVGFPLEFSLKNCLPNVSIFIVNGLLSLEGF